MQPYLTAKQMPLYTWEWCGLTFKIDGQYKPGAPGRFSGPPERWEPAEEPDFTIDQAFIGDVDAMDFLQSTFTRDGKNLYDVACREIADSIYLGDDYSLRRAA